MGARLILKKIAAAEQKQLCALELAQNGRKIKPIHGIHKIKRARLLGTCGHHADRKRRIDAPDAVHNAGEHRIVAGVAIAVIAAEHDIRIAVRAVRRDFS